MEMASLVEAIKQYQAVYNGFPIPTNLVSDPAQDFSFGTFGTRTRAAITNATGPQANNAELVAILCDMAQFGNGSETPNRDHALNPKRHCLLAPRLVPDTQSPGVGTDGVYRDPWGNPYIITLDMNNDGRCRDAFYRLASVSCRDSGTNGLVGLSRLNSTNGGDTFEVPEPIIVWSLGPDGKAAPSRKANKGVNKDNILSWRR